MGNNNRMILLLSLAILGCLLGAYALLFYPQQKKKELRMTEEVRMTEALVQAAQEQLSRAEASLAELLQAGVPVYPASQGGWARTMSAIMQGIDEWVRKSNVTLTRLEPEASEERPPLVVHPFSLEFAGGFSEVRTFMNALERDLRMVPTQWALEAEPKGAAGVRATCRAIVYEWNGKVLRPPPPSEGVATPVEVAGRRDPFARVKAGYVSSAARTGAAALELSGIVEIGGRRKAIINGKPFAVGERVGDKRIVSITEDQVVLEGQVAPLIIRRPLQVVAPASGG
jgi:Tfp pilus assembly protein PilO